MLSWLQVSASNLMSADNQPGWRGIRLGSASCSSPWEYVAVISYLPPETDQKLDLLNHALVEQAWLYASCYECVHSGRVCISC